MAKKEKKKKKYNKKSKCIQKRIKPESLYFQTRAPK